MVINERNLLTKISHSGFIVNCLEASQDTKHLFLLMEYMPGGDLRYLMYRYRRRFSEGQSSIYYLLYRISGMLPYSSHRSSPFQWCDS
jgi:serine/threonine protein kinase